MTSARSKTKDSAILSRLCELIHSDQMYADEQYVWQLLSALVATVFVALVRLLDLISPTSY
jgi:hypothetical protein